MADGSRPYERAPRTRRRALMTWAGTALAFVAMVVGFLVVAVVILVRQHVLDEGFYADALVDADAYERVYTDVLADPELADAKEDLLGGLDLGGSSQRRHASSRPTPCAGLSRRPSCATARSASSPPCSPICAATRTASTAPSTCRRCLPISRRPSSRRRAPRSPRRGTWWRHRWTTTAPLWPRSRHR